MSASNVIFGAAFGVTTSDRAELERRAAELERRAALYSVEARERATGTCSTCGRGGAELNGERHCRSCVYEYDFSHFDDPPLIGPQPRTTASPSAQSAEVAKDARRIDKLESLGWDPVFVADVARKLATGELDKSVEPLSFVLEHNFTAKWLVALAAETDTGKTTAGVVLALRSSLDVVYVTAPALARAAHFPSAAERYLNARALLVDDLGLEPLDEKGKVRSLLTEISDVFSNGRRLLVVTSNVLGRDVERRYGERFAVRWRRCGVWQEFGGARRLTAARQTELELEGGRE